MVTAFVLITAQRDAINETAQQILDINGVAEVYSTAGEWDLVAVVRVKSNDALAEVVTNRLLKITTILRSQTIIAFRAYSSYDLERMFSIGLEDA